MTGNGSHGAITDANGNYKIINLEGGIYRIYVEADGWSDQEYTGNVTVTSQHDTPNINFTLQQVDECFIATAAFGSKFDWPVTLLRDFRNHYLLTNSLGTAFVNFYYQNSPPIAAVIATIQPLKILVKVLLTPIIAGVFIIYHPVILAAVLLLLIALFAIRLSRFRRRYV